MEGTEDDGRDLALQLAFSFLKWEELLKSVDLVCKRWHMIAATDAVWKRYCDRGMELMQHMQHMQHMPSHTLMARELESQPRMTYRDIFVTSRRMGDALYNHRHHGPECTAERDVQRRSLRESCLDDFHWIVHPTIEVLRNIFGEPRHLEATRFSLETQQKNEIKNRLLDFARKDPLREAMLNRNVISLEKEDLARRAAEYLLATATLKDKRPDDLIFGAQSLSVTFGQMIEKFELVAGKETTFFTTVKHTPQGFEQEISFDLPVPGRSLCKMDWPLSASDTLYFLIKELWPNFWRLDFSENRDEQWDRAVRQWWLSLADPIREALAEILRTRVAGVPEFEHSTDVSLEHLHLIVDEPLFMHGLQRKIWDEMKKDVEDTLLDIYLKRSRVFLDAIAREYSCVYGDEDVATNAKLLLQIFLEVPPLRDGATFPALTKEYCQNLPIRIENAMNRWNELAEASWNDVTVSRNPQTAVELNALAWKFGIPFPRNRLSLEFNVKSLEMKFLNSVLASPEYIPEYHDIRKRAEDMVKEFARLYKDGVLQVPQHEFESRYREWLDGVVRDFTLYRDHIHIREHAMLALIPMMQHLSSTDSKRLIYAFFIQQTYRGEYDKSFSHNHFGTITFHSSDCLPCGQGQDNDNFKDVISWIKNHSNSIGRHGTLERLFGLPLPRNIVAAMADFLVERLYQHRHPSDVDSHKSLNAMNVLPFLERSVRENPENAPLVWECLDRALQNAIQAVQDFEEEDIPENGRLIFARVTKQLLAACISTRALPAVPTIRRLYEGTPFAIVTQQGHIIPLATCLEMVQADPRTILNASTFYSKPSE